MILRKTLPLLMMLLLAATAFARIGQPAEATLAAMTDAELYGLAESEQFSVDAELAGEYLFRLSGSAVAGDTNLERLGEVIGHATGFGSQIAVPVHDFLTANLDELLEVGSAVIPVENSYLLELAVSEEGGVAVIDWQFGLTERDTDLFSEVRHYLGADADSVRVVIREFADMQCPHCATFGVEVMPLIEELLAADPGLRFEFHHFPLVNIHANAISAAEAAECVADANTGSEAFFEFSSLIFERQQAWSQLPETGPYFISLAQENGFGTDGVAECLADRRHVALIRDSADHAAMELGVRGTPTVFVDGFLVADWNVRSGYTDLITLIDARNDAP